MEFGPVFKRVVGGSEVQRKELASEIKHHTNRSGEDMFSEALLTPTPEEQEGIKLAVDYVNTLSKQYGGTQEVSSSRVFVIKNDSPRLLTAKENVMRGMSNAFQNICAAGRTDDLVSFASTVVHEGLHMTAYNSVQISNSGKDKPYRSGLGLHGRNNEAHYFASAEEGIIAELTHRFVVDILANHPVYKEQLVKTELVKNWIRSYAQNNATLNDQQRSGLQLFADEIVSIPKIDGLLQIFNQSDIDDEYKFEYIKGWVLNIGESDKPDKDSQALRERMEERHKLKRVIDRVVQSANGLITAEGVFDEFARAHFTGNYLPLARVVEGALGKGSFREIAIRLGDTDLS